MIYRISPKQIRSAKLYLKKDGTFQLIERGYEGLLLSGPFYILVKGDLADLLKSYDLELIPAKISSRDKPLTEYYQVNGLPEANTDFGQHQKSGINFFQLSEGYFFISSEIYLAHKPFWDSKFQVSKGFSGLSG